MEVEITKDNFETLRNGDLPLVVDLWATWCGPCKAISPLVSKLAEEYDGKLVVGKCDVEQNEDITMEYAVRNIPTLLFFKDGKLVTNGGRVLGVTATAPTLDEAIQKAYADVKKIHFDKVHYRTDIGV